MYILQLNTNTNSLKGGGDDHGEEVPTEISNSINTNINNLNYDDYAEEESNSNRNIYYN